MTGEIDIAIDVRARVLYRSKDATQSDLNDAVPHAGDLAAQTPDRKGVTT